MFNMLITSKMDKFEVFQHNCPLNLHLLIFNKKTLFGLLGKIFEIIFSILYSNKLLNLACRQQSTAVTGAR